MIAARALHAVSAALDKAAAVALHAAHAATELAYALDPDPRFDTVCDSVQWLQDHHGWPLDPDGYRPDGTHHTEDK